MPYITSFERLAREEGLQEGERRLVERLLKARFGELDDRLRAIIAPLLSLSEEEYSQLMLQLMQLSREELIARFEGRSPTLESPSSND